VFDDLATRGGWCSPSDFRQFGFNSTAAMRPHIKSLEQENLVSTTLNDESDKRRKTIIMTPRAWLVQYARNGYRSPTDTYIQPVCAKSLIVTLGYSMAYPDRMATGWWRRVGVSVGCCLWGSRHDRR